MPLYLSEDSAMSQTCAYCRSVATTHTCTHLWGYQGENLGKDHMTDESKNDMIAECIEPHHPFEVRNILWQKNIH